MKNYQILAFVIFYLQGGWCSNNTYKEFSNQFSFGAATSAYQVEGAWNVSRKGINLWDYITHNLNIIADGSNGDIACDSYNKFNEDIKLLKSMGVDHYRFSISWSRILPTGQINDIDWEGVKYYNTLINKLLDAKIEPWATIYHFDHPYSIDIMGGWFQSKIVDYISEYADFLFSQFGDRVKTWITINEPYSICVNYMPVLGTLRLNGTIEYVCGENILKAHGAIWKVYQKYKKSQHGKLSMAFSFQAYLPATNDSKDIEAAERVNEFVFGWFVNPVIYGNYPNTMIATVNFYSQKQGFKRSRLPRMSSLDSMMLKGSYDFIGINNYDTYLVSASDTIDKYPSYANDLGATIITPEWNTSYSIQMKALGFGEILKWVKKTYCNPEIRILEQGIPDQPGTIDDYARNSYLKASLNQLWHSINDDKVNVTGYTFWSLMDNFEWTSGYSVRYGLYYVNFTNIDRPRIPKLSAKTFTTIAKSKSLKEFS